MPLSRIGERTTCTCPCKLSAPLSNCLASCSPVQVNYVVKAGRGFDSPTGPSAAAEVVSNYLRTAWLWEMVRVQARLRLYTYLCCCRRVYRVIEQDVVVGNVLVGAGWSLRRGLLRQPLLGDAGVPLLPRPQPAGHDQVRVVRVGQAPKWPWMSALQC